MVGEDGLGGNPVEDPVSGSLLKTSLVKDRGPFTCPTK